MNTVIAVARFEAAEETVRCLAFLEANRLRFFVFIAVSRFEAAVETVSFCIPGDCAILVQNLVCTLLPSP